MIATRWVLLLWVYLLQSCGTEVGNGHSGPEKIDNREEEQEVPTTSSKGSIEEPAQDTSIPEAASAPASRIGSLHATMVPFLNGCASPFASTDGDAIDLALETGETLSASKVEGTWTIQWQGEEYVVEPTPSLGDQTAQIETSEADFDQGYACGDITTNPSFDESLNASVQRYEVTLTLEDQEIEYFWDLDESGEQTILVRIGWIDPETGEELVLE